VSPRAVVNFGYFSVWTCVVRSNISDKKPEQYSSRVRQEKGCTFRADTNLGEVIRLDNESYGVNQLESNR